MGVCPPLDPDSLWKRGAFTNRGSVFSFRETRGGKDAAMTEQQSLRLCVAMTTVAPPFFLLCWLLQAVSSAFPEEPGPLNYIPTEVVRRHAVFLGRPHRTWLRQEPLHIQRILQVNRTLYIGARYIAHTRMTFSVWSWTSLQETNVLQQEKDVGVEQE
ncbi:hypothetical protein F7725_027473 [Dissostichus mawsoni]|uniref:Uncharacterized protein n=1 Tax=Dissostichus mawsoni TaxID=36200 RepID=A0A7J5XD08_DISMA|nr:hypothetical protein F7725_027473 [Dissostichus mawsoni]